MGFFELFLIGIGLSMDAFAVAICKGLGMERINKRDTLLLALFFGGFQALMPLTGYLLGSRFASYIERWDHWIAFVLLAFIGGNMIRESREQEEEEIEHGGSIRYRELFTLAVATSIDALAVGVSFAFLGVRIAPAVTLIFINSTKRVQSPVHRERALLKSPSCLRTLNPEPCIARSWRIVQDEKSF